MSRADGLVRTRDGDLVPDPDALAADELETARRAEAEYAAAAAAHECADGWLGEDGQGRPVPCAYCRPHLLARAARADGVALSGPTIRRDRGAGRLPTPTQPATTATTTGATMATTTYALTLPTDVSLDALAGHLEHRAGELRSAAVAESAEIAAARQGRSENGRRVDVRGRAIEVVLELARASELEQAAAALRQAAPSA